MTGNRVSTGLAPPMHIFLPSTGYVRRPYPCIKAKLLAANRVSGHKELQGIERPGGLSPFWQDGVRTEESNAEGKPQTFPIQNIIHPIRNPDLN